MASSTEEVSGGNMDVSTAESSRHHDTTDTEQRFGIYMREFDFLDCEVAFTFMKTLVIALIMH